MCQFYLNNSVKNFRKVKTIVVVGSSVMLSVGTESRRLIAEGYDGILWVKEMFYIRD